MLDADRAGHEVLELAEVRRAARRRWGAGILGPDGRIDRGALSPIVFAPAPEGPREREYLEKLTHPRIRRRLERQATQLINEGKPALVLDAALIFEAGWNDLCNVLVFVEAPREARLARARRRGYSEALFAAREAAQESLSVKRERADMIIDNSASGEWTRSQVERCWHSLIG